MDFSKTTTLHSPPASSDEPSRLFLDEEVLSRRRFFSIGLLVGVAAHLAFALINSLRGVIGEAILDVCLGAVLLVGFFIHRRLKGESRVVSLILACTVAISISDSFFFEQNAAHAAVIGVYIIPPLALFTLGARYGIRFAIFVLVPILAIALLPQVFGRTPLAPAVPQRLVGSLLIVTVLAWIQEKVRDHSWHILFRTTETLREATRALEALEGLIPICSYCKKIRRDERYWQNLETYLRHHTSAQISSGSCPNCSGDQGAEDRGGAERYSIVIDEASSNWNVSKKMKRWTSIGVMSAGVAALWGVALFETVRGYSGNTPLFLAVSIPYIGCIVLQKKNRWVAAADNIFIGSIVILAFQQVIWAQHNTFALFWLFIIPISANFLAGSWTGTFWSGVTLVLLVLLFAVLPPDSSGVLSFEFKIKFAMYFAIVSLLAFIMESSQERYLAAAIDRFASLKRTYGSIRTLKGLVPVCASCKSIRDDAGFWTSLEEYLIENTNLKLSHGICPRCLRDHHPEVYQEMREKEMVIKVEDMRLSSFSAGPVPESTSPSKNFPEDDS